MCEKNYSAIILGAGFSFVAGKPLTRKLFDTKNLPKSTRSSSENADKSVLAAYKEWSKVKENNNAEKWLEELYSEKDNDLQYMRQGTTWSEAIRFALRRLVDEIPNGKNTPYYYGISNYNCHPIHEKFWEKANEELDLKCIVSMNYDILPEQALRNKDEEEEEHSRSAPNCYYGGFQYYQTVRKMTDVTKNEYQTLELGHDFVLYKMHGSLNWAWEKHSPSMKIHEDVRAIFRYGKDVGVPAIIPPIPEKEMPKRFSQIWYEAADTLKKCDNWVVCGYSLPKYDYALRKFFKKILFSKENTHIVVLDPNSDEIKERWRSLAPDKVTVNGLPGIPESLSDSWI